MSSFTSPPLYTFSGYVQDILQLEFYQAELPSIPALCGGSTGNEIRERWCYVLRREGSECNIVSDSDDSMEVDSAPSLAPSPKQRSRKTSDFNASTLQIVVYSDLNLKLHTYVSVSGYIERSEDDGDENLEMLHCKTVTLGRSSPPKPRDAVNEQFVLKILETKLSSEPLSSLLLLWLLSGKEKSDSTIGQLSLTFSGGDSSLVANLNAFVSEVTDDSTLINSFDLSSDELELRKIGEDRIKFSKLQGAAGKAVIVDYTDGVCTNEANKTKNMKYIDECVKDGAVKCRFGFFDGKMDGDYRYITVEPKKAVSFEGEASSGEKAAGVIGRTNVTVKLKEGMVIKGEGNIGENDDIKDFVNWKRSLCSSRLVLLPPPVCAAAETLFVAKRRSPMGEKIGEVDLERWLTFTRLYARLRGEVGEKGITASVADFESAVELDLKLKEQGFV
ncbi:hypothetical protein TrST_g26 [Triparma strigata]|uniref:Uncharacterized protein n=1 Tax=Triparma strigata TaxID=1606541 RepID=A0A9W7ASK8_9STRA|nr:hypothetical protein TrST_g26 [Triparma strigata]